MGLSTLSRDVTQPQSETERKRTLTAKKKTTDTWLSLGQVKNLEEGKGKKFAGELVYQGRVEATYAKEMEEGEKAEKKKLDVQKTNRFAMNRLGSSNVKKRSLAC